MKTISNTFSNLADWIGARRASTGGLAALLIGLGTYSWNTAICVAEEAAADAQGAEVLTRGPVHEAFAGIVTFNPEPGVIVTKAPPVPIEEIPPGERPAGTNITWIPGYWAWDDERSDFLWVSGTWRALPPGRQWIAGYWGTVTDGYQWTSGYWADAAVEETTYLPKPPATVEDGPSTEAPSKDYGWTPGSWMYQQDRYAWSPGYWAQGRANWDWTPAHYVWTPRGYVYVGGFWDYSVERRGTVFAPVYFDSGVYSQPGYSYAPSIALDLALFAEHLFLRPRYNHYYFGDYYAPSYDQGGYYAAASYQSYRNGYDPIYAQQRWVNRNNQAWNQQAIANYQYRRANESARPPRTWAAMRTLDATSAANQQNRAMLATPIDQLAKRKGGPMKYQPVAKADRQLIAQRGQQLQQSREQRRTLEAKGAGAADLQAGAAAAPTKVKLAKSPIVAKSAGQLPKGQAPPKMQRAPQADLTGKPQPGTPGRQAKGDPGNPQLDPSKTKAAPGRNGAAPRTPQGQVDRTQQGADKKPAPAQRGKDTLNKPHLQPDGTQQGADKKPAPAQRGKDTLNKPQLQPDGTQQGADKKPAPAQRGKDTLNQPKLQPDRAQPDRAPQGAKQPKLQQPQQGEAPQPKLQQPKLQQPKQQQPQREAPQPKLQQPKLQQPQQPQQRAAPQLQQPQQRAAPQLQQPQQRAAPQLQQPQQRAAQQPAQGGGGNGAAQPNPKDKKKGQGGN
jgi:hypothetical protein